MNGINNYKILNVPFDQYQRYKITSEIINLNREKNEQFSILEVGANEHQNLELFLPNDKISYLDIREPLNMKNKKNFILGDATDMKEIADNSFDIVVALDVFEHIEEKKRKCFLNEINRVKNKFFIIANPFNTDGVKEAEIELNNYHKNKYGEDFIWLKEHIQEGLPCLKDTIKYIRDILKINIEYFSHGSLEIWKKLMKLHFDVVGHPDLEKCRNNIDLFYNIFLFKNDCAKNNYRYFLIGGDFKIDSILRFGNIYNISFQEKMYLDLSISNVAIKRKNDEKYIQLYIDNNEGFNETNSIKIFLREFSSNVYKFQINNKNVKHIRLDPLNDYVIVKISNITSDAEIIFKNTNAEMVENNIFYFATNDPQIEFEVKGDISFINFKLDFLEVSQEAVLKKIIEKKNDELNKKSIECEIYKMKVKRIINER